MDEYASYFIKKIETISLSIPVPLPTILPTDISMSKGSLLSSLFRKKATPLLLNTGFSFSCSYGFLFPLRFLIVLLSWISTPPCPLVYFPLLVNATKIWSSISCFNPSPSSFLNIIESASQGQFQYFLTFHFCLSPPLLLPQHSVEIDLSKHLCDLLF